MDQFLVRLSDVGSGGTQNTTKACEVTPDFQIQFFAVSLLSSINTYMCHTPL